jgi:hypothetical protein
MQTATLVIALLLCCAGLAFAIVLLVRKSVGAGRVTGIIGAALLTISICSDLGYSWVFDRFFSQADEARLIGLFVGRTIIAGVLGGVGLVLLAYTISTASQRMWTPSSRKRL